jgi:DNA-binding response OmpR family regulator
VTSDLGRQEVGVACTVIRFDEVELDLGRYELRVAGHIVPLERIPMELLILLVEKRGALATRQEIVDRLWGPGVFVDTEQGGEHRRPQDPTGAP